MIDIENKNYRPDIEEIKGYIGTRVFNEFCFEITEKYKTKTLIEHSCCTFAPGWNVKFKKSGKNLCTVYPKENYFTVLVVIGQREKERAESLLSECSPEIQRIYAETKEGNGQRWLMIDVEDKDEIYNGVMKLIDLRSGK